MAATVIGEPVSVQTVSRLIRDADESVPEFHQPSLQKAPLVLDGLSMRRLSGRQREQMLVSCGTRHDGTRRFARPTGR